MSLITYLTRIHFADRVLDDALAEECRRLGLRRLLLVCDAAAGCIGGAQAPGAPPQARGGQGSGAGPAPEGRPDSRPDSRMDGLPGDTFARGALPLRSALVLRLEAALPPESDLVTVCAADFAGPGGVLRGAKLAEDQGCDAVIGLGGPEALCMALEIGAAGVASLASRPAGARGGLGQAGAPRASAQPGRRPLPVLAVPTTSACAGLPGPAAGHGAARLPTVIFCDPTLALGAPAPATAAEGVALLSAAIEIWLSPAWNPAADAMALDAVRRTAGNLAAACRDTGDLAARRELLAAALNAGLAGAKGRGGAAALVRALCAAGPGGAGQGLVRSGGALPGYRLPGGSAARGSGEGGTLPGFAAAPGALHALVLPAVLRFNRPAIAARLPALAEALGLEPGVPPEAGFAALAGDLGLRGWPDGAALRPEQIASIAEAAAADPAARTNPRLLDVSACRHILEQLL